MKIKIKKEKWLWLGSYDVFVQEKAENFGGPQPLQIPSSQFQRNSLLFFKRFNFFFFTTCYY